MAAQAPEKAGKPGLAPEVEIAFREFSKKAADSRRDQVSKAIEKLAEEVANTVKLDVSAKAKLSDFYPSILEAAQAGWQDRFQEWLLPNLEQSGDALQILAQWDPVEMARSGGVVAARPDRTPAWSDALKAVLSPAQLEKYQAEEQARLRKLKAEMSDHLTASENQALDILAPVMDAEMALLSQIVKLEEARVAGLKTAANTAVQEVVNDWRASYEGRMLDMEDDIRDQWVKTRNFPGLDTTKTEHQPKLRQAWQKAVEEVLTAEERDSIAARRAEYRGRRSEALAVALIEVLDRCLVFSGDQRDRLQTLLAKPLLGLPERYFIPQGANFSSSLDPAQMFGMASSVDQTALASILDEPQLNRWKTLTQRDLARNYSSYYYHSNDKIDGFEFPPEAEMNETEARRLLSAYLHRRSVKVIEARRLIMESRAESIARVTHLGPEGKAMLRTAAKGAAQALAADGIRRLEEWANTEFQRIKPADLPARLKRAIPQFADRLTAGDPQLWTATLERTLSSEQREAWNAELKNTADWKKKCRLILVSSEVEKWIPLSIEKREALRSILEPVLNDYQKEFDQMFSFDWHLSGHYTLLPLAVLTDQQLAPALNKEQIIILRSGIPGHLGEMVDHLRKRHDDRLKREGKSKLGADTADPFAPR